jgi:hypothetical protein
MYNDPTQVPIAPRTDVYDLNGEKIGSVQQYDPQSGYMLVQKGILITKDLYIPTAAIERTTTDGIRLSLSKDELKDDRYTAPPAGTMVSRQNWDADHDMDRDMNRDTDLNP